MSDISPSATWTKYEPTILSDTKAVDFTKLPISIYTFVLLLGLLFITSITVNVSLLLVFFKKPTLRTTSNRFVINLVVCNLISCMVLLPLVAADLFTSYLPPFLLWPQCLLSQAVTQIVAALSLLSTVLVGTDQYLAVLRPLRYHHYMTRTISNSLISIVWVISSIAALGVFILPYPNAVWKCCPTSKVSSSPPTLLFLVISIFLVTFFLPTLTLVIIYCKIYSEAHNNSKRTRRNSLKIRNGENIYNIANTAVVPLSLSQIDIERLRNLTGEQQGQKCTPPHKKTEESPQLKAKRPESQWVRRAVSGAEDDRKKFESRQFLSRTASSPSLRMSLSRSFRHRLSNASQFIHREEGRTVKIYLASLSAVIMCWAPFFSVCFVYCIVPLPRLPEWTSTLLLLLCLLYSLVSPFIFAYRHQKIRSQIRQLFCPSSYQPTSTPAIAPPPPPPTTKSRTFRSSSVCVVRGGRVFDHDRLGQNFLLEVPKSQIRMNHNVKSRDAVESQALLRTISTSTDTSGHSSFSSVISQCGSSSFIKEGASC